VVVRHAAPWPLAATATLLCSCVIVPQMMPAPQAGRLTRPDGGPVAGAELTVESWRVDPLGRSHIVREHLFTTRTDSDGRWRVPGRTRPTFAVLLPDAAPAHVDEFTFRAPGHPDLRVQFPPLRSPAPLPEPAALRVDASDLPPISTPLLPVVGVTVGEGQHVAAHVGGMFTIGRRALAAGLRLAGTAGDRGYGGSAGPVLVICCAAAPLLAVELNGRYLRPWAITDDRAPISGPELAIDLAVLRFTVGSYGHEIATPAGDRSYVLGIGYGYF
jgi:hypothetical protein